MNSGDSRFNERSAVVASYALSPSVRFGRCPALPHMQGLRNLAQPFVQDIDSSVDVTVVMLTASGARPLPYGEVFRPRPLRTALGAKLRGGEELVDHELLFERGKQTNNHHLRAALNESGSLAK